MRNYIGQDGFVWWIGVVEGTEDPLKLGRCQVRCFGYHPKRIITDDPEKQPVPPEHLPWATCLMPANLQNFYGRPNAGDWVIGFFLDAKDAQEPVILGILPGIPTVVNEYFSMHPRFAKSFSKIKNDETTNRSQLINTLHSLVDTESKQLVTLPSEGVYLSKEDIDAVRTLLSKSESRSDQTFAFYHNNGSKIEIGDSANTQKMPINKAIFYLLNGSYLEFHKEVLNQSGDTTDYALINHAASGGKVELKTNTTSSSSEDTCLINSSSGSVQLKRVNSGGGTTDTFSINSSDASIELSKTSAGTTINITHPKGASISISALGQITITSSESITIASDKEINLNSESVMITGIGNIKDKIDSMDDQIALAMTLPVPTPAPAPGP